MKIKPNRRRKRSQAEDVYEEGQDSSKHSVRGNRPFRKLRVALILGVVAALSWGGQILWNRVAPQVIARQRYQLSSSAITATPPPAWIKTDVLGQVVRNSELDGRLSIVDENFVTEIKEAFLLHPWVESVGQITKSFPPAVTVEVTYRQPVAVIENSIAGFAQLAPVDRSGISLPTEDVPEVSRRYLPRIKGVVGQPPPGGRWEDPRVMGAVDLASRLLPSWQPLYLMDIIPSARPEIRGPRRYFVYEIITRGGTRIVWGAAPLDSPQGESDFDAKLARLKQCAQRFGPLNTVNTPQLVDIRQQQINVQPRHTAKKTDKASEAKITK